MAAQPAAAQRLASAGVGLARALAPLSESSVQKQGQRLVDRWSADVANDVFSHALKKQTGISLKYMMDFGSSPIPRQLILGAQFLARELPVRLAHRIAELENLPAGLSAKPSILKVSCVRVLLHLLCAQHAQGAWQTPGRLTQPRGRTAQIQLATIPRECAYKHDAPLLRRGAPRVRLATRFEGRGQVSSWRDLEQRTAQPPQGSQQCGARCARASVCAAFPKGPHTGQVSAGDATAPRTLS